jgi:hypothetical protein
MALIPVLALIAIIVGVCRRWGASALWFVAAGVAVRTRGKRLSQSR